MQDQVNRREFLPTSASVGVAVIAVVIAAFGFAVASAAAGIPTATRSVSLSGEDWLIATDPDNVGREQQWWKATRADAKPTRVPWIIQERFPGYHGLAWYWRQFEAPPHPVPGGRYLLKFWAVDYMADVWLNDEYLGRHETGETPFDFDVTEAIKPGGVNRLAVRVLNPTHEPIEGIRLAEVPSSSKAYPWNPGRRPNHGGIEDEVELLLVPPVHIRDVHVRPDLASGRIGLSVELANATGSEAAVSLEYGAFSFDTGAKRAAGEQAAVVVKPGESVVRAQLHVDAPRSWCPDDPYLYRVEVRVRGHDGGASDTYSTRVGFRDFRFEDGYFRLNGKRIYPRSILTGNHFPVSQWVPLEPEMLRSKLIDLKAMGFNMVRYIAGMPRRQVLHLCDEIGLMVYEECFASWTQMAPSPKLGERFDYALSQMIRRDRNHASVVMWGLLNEMPDGAHFRHAVDALPLVRSLDPDRLVVLNSGRWDGDLNLGSMSNPGSESWDVFLGDEGSWAAEEDETRATDSPVRMPGMAAPVGGRIFGDVHAYPFAPHPRDVVAGLRTYGRHARQPVFLSEYGHGTGVNLMRVSRLIEQREGTHTEDYALFTRQLDLFLADFDRWKLSEAFGRPEEYFLQSLGNSARRWTTGLDAMRSNPRIAGISLTAATDMPNEGGGLITIFHEVKPGVADALRDAFAPLRWCLFVEPIHAYAGESIHLEAVLSNEDRLSPGRTYPVRFWVMGPNNQIIWEHATEVTVPEGEPSLAIPVLNEHVVLKGPSGRYRFVAAFEKGAAAAGGRTEFWLTDAQAMPPVGTEVVLFGHDTELFDWLAGNGIATVPFHESPTDKPGVILVSSKDPLPNRHDALRELGRRIASGSAAIFLSPSLPGVPGHQWIPLPENRAVRTTNPALLTCYPHDYWAKPGGIFEGMPGAKGLMDDAFYRDIIPVQMFGGLPTPRRALAGVITTSLGYRSGLTVSVHDLGAGGFILNTMRIRENLDKSPAAERLLRNMLNFAAAELPTEAAPLPPDFDAFLQRVYPQPPAVPQAGAILLDERFAQAGLDAWKPRGGDWSAGNGQCRQSDAEERRAVLYFKPGEDWQDYIVSATVSAGQATERNTGLCFRADSSTGEAYVLRFLDTSNMVLGKISDGGWKELGRYAFHSVRDKEYGLTVVVRGPAFHVYVDGNWVGSGEDDALKKGTVGLYTYGQPATFGPIRVTEIQKASGDEKGR